MSRLLLPALLLLAACKGTLQPPRAPLASAGAVDPQAQEETLASSGVRPGATVSDLRAFQDRANRPVPGELEKAEVVVDWQKHGNRAQLVSFLSDERWMFWGRKENRDGTSTYTFVRLREPGFDPRVLEPKLPD